MKIGRKMFFIILICMAAVIIFLFIRNNSSDINQSAGKPAEQPATATDQPNNSPTPSPEETAASTTEPTASPTASPTSSPTASQKPSKPPAESNSGVGELPEGVAVIAEPESIAALVNKQNKLPEDYAPNDLVYPEVRFLFDEKIEKRMMRKEAAEALEKMFEAAKDDSIHLAGVSAYRSHQTQTALFARYEKKDGREKALTYSAFPGTSEHETGLAIDVSGSTGKCAVQDCFADEEESEWLEEHAFDYGYIIRYPEGKESITGYQYEPWHLRYVGTEISLAIKESGDSLEEYYGVVPVNQ